jgi:WD40 repeat protein
VSAVALSSDGRLALSAGDDLTLKLWDVARGREVDDIDLSSSEDFARCVTFAPDGRSFFAGTADWVILRFELTP